MANIGIAQTAITVTPISTGGGSNAFSALTSSTNTTATMVVGTGATITFSGTGIVNANELYGTPISSVGPVCGQVLQAVCSGSPATATAEWVSQVNYQGYYADYLPGMSIVDPGTFNLAYAANTQIYTVPVGKRAIFLPSFSNWGFIGCSVQQQVIVSGTTYNLSAAANVVSIVQGTSDAINLWTGYIAEAGEIFQVTTTQTALALTKAIPNTTLSFTLTSVAAGTGVYTGTITGGASNAFLGYSFTITGFTNGPNNGSYFCTASTATTLTLSNAYTIAETHAGTAASSSANTGYLGTLLGSSAVLNQETLGQAVVNGFTNGGNNGTFNILDWSTTGFAVTNGSGVAETHAATVNMSDLNMFSTILLFSNQAPTAAVPNLKTVKLLSTTTGIGANALYTVPASTTSYLAGDIPFLSNNTPSAGIAAQTNVPSYPGQVTSMPGNGVTALWTTNFVRSGGSATTANIVGSSLMGAAIQGAAINSIMNAGDAVLITVNLATSAPALIWTNVWEF
jgi:hypothetical protein